jgi:O-glycosyl hydrolase
MGAAWSSPPWMKTNNDWTGTYNNKKSLNITIIKNTLFF